MCFFFFFSQYYVSSYYHSFTFFFFFYIYMSRCSHVNSLLCCFWSMCLPLDLTFAFIATCMCYHCYQASLWSLINIHGIFVFIFFYIRTLHEYVQIFMLWAIPFFDVVRWRGSYVSENKDMWLDRLLEIEVIFAETCIRFRWIDSVM